MYDNDRESTSAAQRSAERRRHEDESPRLKKEIPALTSLRILVTESGALREKKHVKHVVVGSAPALFVFACGDSWCTGGGHDVTTSVLYSLRGLRTEFTGQHQCEGTTGSAPCRRTIEFQAQAVYAR